MLRQDVFFAERTLSEKIGILLPKTVTEMYSHTPKRKCMDEQCLYTERVFGAYERPGMGFPTTPFTQGTYVEVEPPRKRFHTGLDQRVLQNTGPTHREDRLAQSGANQLLNVRQIQNFIASTVLPHHRTLISSDGIKWSNNQPERRPTPQRFQRKAEDLHPAFMPYAVELKNQAQTQFNPQTNDVAHRATINNHEFTEGKVTNFPRGNYIPHASIEKVINIPKRFSELEDEDIIFIMEENPNKISTNPQDFSVTQGTTFIPQGSRIPQETQDHAIYMHQGFSVTQGMANIPQGPRILPQAQDDLICMPQGFSITQGMQEETTSIAQRSRVSQQTQDDVICMSQGFKVPQETHEDIFLTAYGIQERQKAENDIIYISQEISIPQGTLEEISFAPQGINIPLGKQEQDPVTCDLSNEVDFQRPPAWETPAGRVTTTELSAHNQPGSTTIPWGLVPQTKTIQAEVQHEQTPKGNSADNVETHLTNINAESASQFSIAERSRAIAAEVFSEAARYVAQENVDEKSRLEATTDHEHERHTFSKGEPSRKRKRSKSAVVENAINESPMKRQKVHIEAADQTYQTESDSNEKIWSKNNAELDESMEDAVKILRGQSADLFPESVIDQLFKDTFESDIFLTSGDYFVVDPLVFFTSEFEQEINSL
eukprot:XP_011451617.1 PREDICTED: uncharacterized protein LOC105345234 [Crassostrea gigas]